MESSTQNISNNTKLWQWPWQYKESFIITFSILLLGFIIEYVSGGAGFPIPKWPVNFYIGLAYLNTLIIAHYFFRETKLIKWLGGVPASVSGIVVFTILILFMGFTLQDDIQANRTLYLLGISHATSSWAYLFIMTFFLTTLGFVTLQKSFPLKKKNFGFILNHAGLWITIAAASLGAGDLMRLSMNLYEGEANSIAVSEKGLNYRLPFEITLHDFNIEQYDPKVGVIDNTTGTLAGEIMESLVQIEPNLTTELLGYNIVVKEYFKLAEKLDDKYVISNVYGAFPAALLEVSIPDSGIVKQGWITCGNFIEIPKAFRLDVNNSIVMYHPEAKKYSSDITYVDASMVTDTFSLEVNKPVSISGWKVYQLSYDERMGKYSKLSVVELVRDPWLFIVYIGIFMVIIGAFYIFWIGQKINKEE